jgi:hypothetical protein
MSGGAMEMNGTYGGCDRDRTCDPLGVNEVLYR